MNTIRYDSYDYKLCGVYKYLTCNNVLRYEHKNFDSYDLHTIQNAGEPLGYYLILDTEFSQSFFHWIAECAIFIPFFIELKKQYPLLKIICKTKMDYHKIFLDYFTISENDIIYSIENAQNICFFPLPITALNKKTICDDYKLYASIFIEKLTVSMNSIEKTNQFLILPRQSQQNSTAPSGSRVNDCHDIIKNIQNAVILNTDNVTSLYQQIQLVASSKNIIVSDGSAFLFNGLLSSNSTIIVLGDIVISQANDHPKMMFFMDFIKKNNHVVFIPYIHGNFNNCSFLYKDLPFNELFEQTTHTIDSYPFTQELEKYSIILPTRGAGYSYQLFIQYGIKFYEKFLNKKDLFEFIIICPKENYQVVCNDIGKYDFPFKIYNDDDIVDSKYMNEIGWFKQEIIKLNICNFVKTDHYLILDDDIFILKSLSFSDFFDENNRIKYSFEEYSDNSQKYMTNTIWINSACDAIGVDIEYIKLQKDLMGVTPQFFKTQIVKDMLKYLGNEWQLPITQKIASEFQLYWSYIIKTQQKHLYVPNNDLYFHDPTFNIINTCSIEERKNCIMNAFNNTPTFFMVIQSHLKYPIDSFGFVLQYFLDKV